MSLLIGYLAVSQYDSLRAHNHLYNRRNASDYVTWSDDDMATQRPFGVAKGVDTGMASQTTFEDSNGVSGNT